MKKNDICYVPKYTIKGIKDELKKRHIEFVEVDTLLEQGKSRYRRGKWTEFENSLSTKGIGWFAYIKFFVDPDSDFDDENIWAIVAGKTGSNKDKVNKHSDVRFMEYPKKGPAKKWIFINKKKLYHPKIIVIPAETEKKALDVEKSLVKWFGLLES